MTKNRTIALVGAPNCGKTTIFNRATRQNQHIGNWPGVTVDKVSGQSKMPDGEIIDVIDLPGSNSILSMHSATLDEQVTLDFIQQSSDELLVNVIDATKLQRALSLTTQIALLQKPFIIVCNMIDIAISQGININVGELERQFGVPVICTSAINRHSMRELADKIKQTLDAIEHGGFIPKRVELSQPSQQLFEKLQPLADQVGLHPAFLIDYNSLPNNQMQQVKTIVQQFQTDNPNVHVGQLISSDIFNHVKNITAKVLDKNSTHASLFTERMDRIFLDKTWGLPILMFIIYAVFAVSMGLGNGLLVDLVDIVARMIFVDFPRWLLTNLGLPQVIISLVADGIGTGVETVISFAPVIGLMYLCMAVLESSGYMTRAAFVLDYALSKFNLSGHIFLPLILGFGCNVPAISGTKVLSSNADRYAAIMMAPFMSCSARLPIYVFFTAAFFPENSSLIVFSLYIIGILASLFTGIVMRKTLLKHEASPLILEMSLYHRPRLRIIWRTSYLRTKTFVQKITKTVVPMVAVISLMVLFTPTGQITKNAEDSALALVAKQVSGFVEPLGAKPDAWQATVGLITGFLAKEGVVGTMTSLYNNQSNLVTVDQTWAPVFIKDGVVELYDTTAGFVNETLASYGIIEASQEQLDAATIAEQTNNFNGLMQNFTDHLGAYAFLLFVLLYAPCAATFAAIKTQAGWRWSVFSFAWSTSIAYSIAAVFNLYTHLGYYGFGYTLMMSILTLLILAGQIWLLNVISNRKSLQYQAPSKMTNKKGCH